MPVTRQRIKIFFATVIFCYAILAWNARHRILEGNSDFIIYYTAAQIITQNEGERLYELDVQKRYQQEILPSFRFRDGLLPYNHPPFEVIWFLPLAHLSYLNALLLWNIFSLACFGAGLAVLARSSHAGQSIDVGIVCLGSLAFLPLFVTLLQGQDTGMVFLFLALAFARLKKSQEFYSGLWLALVLQKFQILIPILLLFVVKKRWKVLGGFLTGGLVCLFLSLGIVGVSGLKTYLQLVLKMTQWVDHLGVYPSRMYSLRGQFFLLWFDQYPTVAIVMTVIVSLVLIAFLFKAWGQEWNARDELFDVKIALLALISLLVSPHLNLHDLSLLLIPALLIYQFSVGKKRFLPDSRHLLVSLFVVLYPIILFTPIVSGYLPIHLSLWAILGLTGILVNQLVRKNVVSNQ